MFLVQENHGSPYPGYASHSEAMKSPVNGEEMHDTLKKKDVFRPSILDMDSGRRDRWRDEERETNSSGRKDRWREGDKELGDGRRWTDNSSGRHFGEGRRAPAERWTDSSKWNTRWGPDDNKEINSSHEKWTDSGKDTDLPLDKGLSHVTHHGKDEKDGDHYRPWRSNSSQSRGRIDPPPHHQTFTPNKQVPAFAQGRARGENPMPTFSVGRGRVTGSGGSPMNSFPIHSQPSGPYSEKGESGHGDPSPLNYSRMKLLDVYRTTDMRSRANILDVLQVPSLTQEEPVEPLALCAPTPEELVLSL